MSLIHAPGDRRPSCGLGLVCTLNNLLPLLQLLFFFLAKKEAVAQGTGGALGGPTIAEGPLPASSAVWHSRASYFLYKTPVLLVKF